MKTVEVLTCSLFGDGDGDGDGESKSYLDRICNSCNVQVGNSGDKLWTFEKMCFRRDRDIHTHFRPDWSEYIRGALAVLLHYKYKHNTKKNDNKAPLQNVHTRMDLTFKQGFIFFGKVFASFEQK